MTKKFVSLVLSLALVIGLLPMMSVSAMTVSGTEYYTDNFENYNLGDSWYDSASGTSGTSVVDKSGTTKWASAGALKGEIVTENDDNGNPTQAMKITLVTRDGNFGGNERFHVKGAGTANTTGIQVVEAKFYIPGENGISRFTFGQIRKYNNELDISNDDYTVNTSFNVSNKWVKVTLVVNLDTDESIVYVNDKVVSYHKYSVSKSIFPSYLQVNAGSAGSYIILDDVVMYHTPSSTTVSTVYSDASNVSSKVSPVIKFSEKLLNTSVHSDGIISKDNIEFYKTADSSATVEINDPVVSADDKSITIDPVIDELDGGVEYTVVVKNLKDMYGRDIPAATFNFTIAEPSAITVSQPVFSRENLFVAGASQAISTLETGYIKASTTVNNSANTDKEVMVLAMLKEGDDIKYFQFDNIAVPANGSAAFNSGFQVDNVSTQKIEVVVWDSIYNKTPLADKYAFSSSGLVKTDLENLLGE